MWRALRAELGLDAEESEKSQEADRCADAMEKWAEAKGKDMSGVEDAICRVLAKAVPRMFARLAELLEEVGAGNPDAPIRPDDREGLAIALVKHQRDRLLVIQDIAQKLLAMESIDDVKYVMRSVDDILALAGGTRTNAW